MSAHTNSHRKEVMYVIRVCAPEEDDESIYPRPIYLTMDVLLVLHTHPLRRKILVQEEPTTMQKSKKGKRPTFIDGLIEQKHI